MAENAGSAQRSAPAKTSASTSHTLRLRVMSAAVMAPVAIAAVWAGPPWIFVLVGAAVVGMAWEWWRVCRGPIGGHWSVLLVDIAAVTFLIAVELVWGASDALLWTAVGAAVVWASARMRDFPSPIWLAVGTIWIVVPCLALIWLVADPEHGQATVLWLFAIVWATDIGAYFAGRTFGGPRLAPSISPSKTWSGLAGGVLAAGMVGVLAALLLAEASISFLLPVSAGLAVVAQLGDLAESFAKRRFGVKDSSTLIPGHGGILDRLDGVLTVAPTVALLTLIGGISVLTWR